MKGRTLVSLLKRLRITLPQLAEGSSSDDNQFSNDKFAGYTDNPLRHDLGRADAAILIPAAFFLSVASPTANQPNGLMNLAYIDALFLVAAVLSLGVGLVRAARRTGR